MYVDILKFRGPDFDFGRLIVSVEPAGDATRTIEIAVGWFSGKYM